MTGSRGQAGREHQRPGGQQTASKQALFAAYLALQSAPFVSRDQAQPDRTVQPWCAQARCQACQQPMSPIHQVSLMHSVIRYLQFVCKCKRLAGSGNASDDTNITSPSTPTTKLSILLMLAVRHGDCVEGQCLSLCAKCLEKSADRY